MPRIVTSKKRQRPSAPPANASDRAIKAVSIAIVVICAAFAAWRLWAPGETGGDPRPAPKAEPAAPSANRPGLRDRPNDDTPAEAAPAAEAAARGRPGLRGGASGPAATTPGQANADDATTSPAPPTVVTPREREFFDNEIENTIASVSEPGAEFFGFPPGTDLEEDEIIEILRRPIEIQDDDDEATIAAKERTAEFKAKALKAIEEDGLTFNQFVRDQVALRNEQAAMREDAYQEMVKILRRDGESAARDYLNSVNPELKAQGMKEIVITPFLLEDAANR